MSTTLSDNFSWLILPFYFPQPFVGINETGLWVKENFYPKDTFLLESAQHFFEASHADCMQVYSLRENSDDTHFKNFQKFWIYNHEFNTGSQILSFKFSTQDFLKPRLWIVPKTNVGLLTLGIEIIKPENPTLATYTQFNYHLRNLTSGQIYPIHTPNRSTHEKAIAERELLINFLHQYQQGIFEVRQTTNSNTWFLTELLNFLLNDFSEKIKLMGPNRMHVFSYFQTQQDLPDHDFRKALYRIVKIFNENYSPTQDSLNSNHIYQTFEEVYMGVSTEGGAIGLIALEDAPPLIKEFKNQALLPRYIWVYLLAYYQRVALINMNRILVELFNNTQTPTHEQLLNKMVELSSIQIKATHTEVSYYSQHNDFYELCQKNFKLTELLTELKDKLRDTDRIVFQQQAQLEEQRSQKLEKLLGTLIFIDIWLAFFNNDNPIFSSFVTDNPFWFKSWLNNLIPSLPMHSTGAVLTVLTILVLLVFLLPPANILFSDWWVSIRKKKHH